MASPHRTARLVAVSLVAAFTLAACSDGRDVSTLTGVQRAAVNEVIQGATIDAQVTWLLYRLYPASTASSLDAWWGLVKKKVSRNDPRGAQQTILDMVPLMNGRIAQVTPLDGETQEQSIAHVVLLMSIYVSEGPGTPPPVVPPQAEATLAVVQPTEPTTIQTPSEQAGVMFPAGAVNVPTVVVVTRTDDALYPEECAGPLPTTRCQYPAFYKFNVFPDVKLNAPATIAVCREENGSTKMPRADHDRFRLAHQKPTDPAAYVEGGTIEGDIEILPFRRTDNLVECPHSADDDHGEYGALAPGAGLFQRLAATVRRAVAPTLLYAIDRGGGGAVLFFSDFVMIDPASQSDLYLPDGITTTTPTVPRGQNAVVRFRVGNRGSGPSAAFTNNEIVLSTNPSLDGGIVLSTLGESTIFPAQETGVRTTAVTIPNNTPPGTYWVGVRLDFSNLDLESDESNNTAAVQITVSDPGTFLCAEGGYATVAEAVANTPAGGTINACPGEYTVETVLVDKPLTIQAHGTVKPVFRTQTNLEGLLLRHTTGTVTLRRIEFRNAFAETTRNGATVFSYSVRANTNFANIDVIDSDFLMATGGHASGMIVASGGVAGNSRLQVINSSFTGGRAAIAVAGTPTAPPPSSTLITLSRFQGQRAATAVASNFAIQVTGAAPNVVISENSISDCGDRCVNINGAGFQFVNNQVSSCGPFTCVSGSGSSGLIAGNVMSNRVTGEYDFFFHHVVLTSGAGTFTIENNQIDGCGRGQCILAINRASGTIRNNHIRGYHVDATRVGIGLGDGQGGQAPQTDIGANMVVRDNIIEGVGGAMATAPDVPASYPFSLAGIIVEGHSSATIENNQVQRGNFGLLVTTGGTVTGTRNTVTGSRVGSGIFDAGTQATMNWNDFVDFRRAFDHAGSTTSNLTCNWWGAASGPVNFTPQQSDIYSPWATQPVAATGSGPCNGTSDPQYAMTMIGTADGRSWATAKAINASGRVVGQGGNQFADWQGWVWESGATPVPVNLPNPCGDWYSANDINDNHLIAMGSAYCAFAFQSAAAPASGSIVNMQAPPPSNRSHAYAVNNAGLVLACSDNGSFAYNYIWDRSSNEMTTLPQQYANHCHGDINRDGLAIISSEHGGVLLWNQTNRTSMPVPSSISGHRHFGSAISDAAVVVGRACTDAGACRAWRWVPGMPAVQDLGTLGGANAQALGVNSAGFIVGWAETAGGQKHAFVWNPNTQRMSDLGVLAGTSESVANAINDSGVIVGSSGVVQTNSRAVRWTPASP